MEREAFLQLKSALKFYDSKCLTSSPNINVEFVGQSVIGQQC